MTSVANLSDEQKLDRRAIQQTQRQKLAALWHNVLPHNPFYSRKFAGIKFDPLVDPMMVLPLTTRAELEADQIAHPPYGTNLSFPLQQYVRLHKTSGSGGQPLRWLDTADGRLKRAASESSVASAGPRLARRLVVRR